MTWIFGDDSIDLMKFLLNINHFTFPIRFTASKFNTKSTNFIFTQLPEVSTR